MMPARREFNLLVVHGDGRRIARLTLPRWLILTVLGLFLAVPASVTVIYNDYLTLRSQRASLNELTARVAEQQGDHRRLAVEDAPDPRRDRRLARSARQDPGSPSAPRTALPSASPASAAAPARRGPPRPPSGAAIGDELERLTGIVKEEGDNLRALERFLGRATRVLAALPSRWPVRGQINSGYGGRTSPWSAKSEFHSGLDIGAPVGTPVKSPAPGTVVFAGVNAEYGQTLIIDHGNETKSLYGHLSKLNVGREPEGAARGGRSR